MSDINLSEQLGRVDGAQNDILKAIVKAFGITLSNEKIDEIADLVTASGKFKQGALLSSETTALYPDLPENPTPDDVFRKILTLFQSYSKIEVGSYIGTGSKVTSITVGIEPELLIVYHNGSRGLSWKGVMDAIGIIPCGNGLFTGETDTVYDGYLV